MRTRVIAFAKDESNPFCDWSSHINKPVYSIDEDGSIKCLLVALDDDCPVEIDELETPLEIDLPTLIEFMAAVAELVR